MSRPKQINVTVPKDKVQVLDDFDKVCKLTDTRRSEGLVQLMAEYVSTYEMVHGKLDPDVKASPTAQQSAQAMVDEFGTGVVAKPEVKAAQKELNEVFSDAVDAVGVQDIPEWLR